MRRTPLLAVLLTTLGGAVAGLAPGAEAQTGYPPGTCTATVSAQDAGAHRVGETFAISLTAVCAFSPGNVVSVSVDGQFVLTKPVAVDGTVTVTVTVRSATELLIDDPVLIRGHCGGNSVAVTGPSSAARGMVTHTATFDVRCDGRAPAPVARRAGAGLARTGADIGRSLAIAVLLGAAGAVLVRIGRQRRARRRALETGAGRGPLL